MTDILDPLLRANLALAIAVAGVMAARLIVRRLFGPRIAYGLWILPPLAAAAMLAPARVVTMTLRAMPVAAPVDTVSGGMVAPLATPSFDLRPLLAGLWLVGVLASLAWLVWRQWQFACAVRAGRAGPAVIGVLRPRVVTPADFAERYTPREREIVLAHEHAHLARKDPAANAVLALLTCLNWFNPAVHVMSRWLRVDQELACDARVVAAHPGSRRTYAEAMLKTQLAARPLPLGCHWSSHPLAERVRLLSRPVPSQRRRLAGAGVVVVLAISGGLGVWAARPADVVWVRVADAPATRLAPVQPSRPQAPSRSPRTAAPVRRVSVSEPPAIAPATPPADPPIDPPMLRRPKIIFAAAQRSQVQPGSAVRVVASGVAPDGVPLWADFTAFGSQRIYRKGSYERGDSRYSLFTSVVQDGEHLRVTVSLGKAFRPDLTGSIDLAPNQSGTLRLPTGQSVAVTAIVRPETADEMEEGRQLTAYAETLPARLG